MIHNKFKNPPKLAERILRRLYPDRGTYTSLGDFREEYLDVYQTSGLFKANLWYWMQIAKSIPNFIRNKSHWSVVMISIHIKTALRSIKRHKGYSIVNIVGLAIGMACFFLIMLFIRWELSYDSFHERADRLFRVVVKSKDGTTFNLGKTTMGVIPSPMAVTMAEEFPEVVNVTRVHGARNVVLTHAGKKFEENGLYADPNFLKILSFPLEKGNAETALRDPLTMVITQELGKKYFGNVDPVGKTLTFPYGEKSVDIKVTGILKKIPNNSHLQFDFLMALISWMTLKGEARYVGRWGNWDAFIYVELSQNTDPIEFAKKLPDHYAKHSGSQGTSSFILQPIKSIHLKSDAFIEISENNKMSNIYIFSCIAFVILFIACINYINLVTARASRRSREIGVRKVVGAQRQHLIRQFLAESIFLSIIAFSTAVVLLILVFPSFSAFMDNSMEMHLFKDITFKVGLIGSVFLIGILAGIFPALFMSSFHPVSALKGNASSSTKKFNVRNVLVVLQFSVSIILIAGTLIITKQMDYVRKRNMGFDREQVLVVEFKDIKLRDSLLLIKNKVLQNSNILGATLSNNLPSYIVPMIQVNVEEGSLPDSQDIFGSYYTVVDQDFLDVYGIELISGRDFSIKYANESEEAVIINETVVRQLGWKEPLGKMYRTSWAAKNGRVIGVIKDFHFLSLHQTIQPLTLIFDPKQHRYLSLKINPTDLNNTIAFVRETVESFKSDYPFTYFFLDDSFNEMYLEEKKLGTLFRNFSALAIFISCLGLFGLASFAVETRTKEVGIRKVLGASLTGLFLLLTKEFTKWVLLANVIAWPVAYYCMNKWLQSFAYRSEIGLFVFMLSGFSAMAIALLVVSFQSIKAATANPVDSLRYE